MGTPLQCPHCGKRYQMRAEWAGKKIRCRVCKRPFVAPAIATTEPIALALDDLTEATPPPVGVRLPVQAPDPLATSGPTLLTPVATRRRRRATNHTLKLGAFILGSLAILAVAIVAVVFLFTPAWPKTPSADLLRAEEWMLGETAVNNELADTLATMKDGPSSEAARPKLMALKARDNDLKKIQAGHLTSRETRALDWKHGAKVEASLKKLERESERVKQVPEAREVFAQVWSGQSAPHFRPPILPTPRRPPSDP